LKRWKRKITGIDLVLVDTLTEASRGLTNQIAAFRKL